MPQRFQAGGHDRDHPAQLCVLARRLVRPGMGDARRLSVPDA